MNCAIHDQAPATAYCRTCGKAMCNDCTREVKGLIYCEDCLASSVAHTTPAASGSGPNPTIAAVLSAFVCPGLGQVYAGDVMRGVMVALVFAGMIFVGINLDRDSVWAFLGLGIAFWYFFQIFDAVRVAKARRIGRVAPDPFGLSSPGAFTAENNGNRLPFGAIVLIVLGVFLLLGNLFDFHMFSRGWPLILIFFGVLRLWSVHSRNANGCRCVRCQSSCMMWPAILITLGVLFLIDENTRIGFDRTFPILLIVIGGVKFLQLSGSTEGHIASPVPSVPAPDPQQSSSDQVHHG